MPSSTHRLPRFVAALVTAALVAGLAATVRGEVSKKAGLLLAVVALGAVAAGVRELTD